MPAYAADVDFLLEVKAPSSLPVQRRIVTLSRCAAAVVLGFFSALVAHAQAPESERIASSRRTAEAVSHLPPINEIRHVPSIFELSQGGGVISPDGFVVEGEAAGSRSVISLLQEAPAGEAAMVEHFAVDEVDPSPLRPAQPASQVEPPLSVEREIEELKKRLDELDVERQAHEDATRTVIRQTLSEQQSGINDFVTLGGTIEGLVFWAEDFDGNEESRVVLDTAELDFEVHVNDWSTGSLVVEYFDGNDFVFPTTEGDEQFVDRVNIRQAYITLGDPFKCPPYMTIGRDVVPFGISTGDPVTDVLSIVDPLTVEVFEMQEDFILFGIAFPTPPPPPLPVAAYDRPGALGRGGAGPADTAAATAATAAGNPPVDPLAPLGPPPIQPVLFAPIAHAAGSKICKYCGCYPYTPPPAWTPWIEYPKFDAAVYFFNGDTINEISEDDRMEHWGATIGYRTRGCLGGVPWSFDGDIDFNSSVFDSDFLGFEYRRWLADIGYIPGMAAHIKGNLGPFALVLEWNGAIDNATFVDQAIDLTDPLNPVVVDGNNIEIRPQAWQVNLAYQFAYRPWLEMIGSEGTYFVVGYSESSDLFGVNRVLVDDAGVLTEKRVGFVPEKRLTVGLGEWVMYGTRVAFEYAHAIDYDQGEGLGTGNSADGFFAQFTYEW